MQATTNMKDLVKKNMLAGRLDAPTARAVDPEIPRHQAGMRLTQEELKRLDEVCKEQERPRAWVARKMFLRGLASYLAEQEASGQVVVSQ